MSVPDTIIGLLAPHRCIGCDAESTLLCSDCQTKLPKVPPRCYRCHRLSTGNRTCLSCRSSSKLYAIYVATVYDELAKTLIWKLKFDGAQAAAGAIAICLRGVLPQEKNRQYLIVPVPTATGRVRRRGYDQAKLLARALAKQARLPYLDCLQRSGQAHQVGASRHDRLRQLKDSFRVVHKHTVRDVHIMLVDDVVTTGATLEAAATALKSVGARRVEATVFAQP